MDQQAPERVTHDYDAIWKNVYGSLQDYGPTHRHMRRILQTYLRDLDYASVLDVGCGAGHNIPLLTEGRQIEQVAGVDISQVALDMASEKYPEAAFMLGDVTRESLPEQWDLVFSSLLLEHVENDVDVLRHMRQMSRKYVLVTTIAGDFERYRAWDEQVGHVRNYQVGELEAKCEQAGLTVERVNYWGFPFFTPFARTLQNHMKSQSAATTFSRISAEIMYYLYFMNSWQRGDLLVLLARPSA